MADTPVITGTLLTLKLLLPLFPSASAPVKENSNTINHPGSQPPKNAATVNAVAVERIVQVSFPVVRLMLLNANLFRFPCRSLNLEFTILFLQTTTWLTQR